MTNAQFLRFWTKFSSKMACESTKCYSTAIYTTIMVVLSLQLLSTIERQVFDFLGYMWAPIIGNFFQILCTILGIFGTYQYRPKFIAVYTTWSLVWLGWNVFVICLYLEVGVLNRNREIYILNIGTRNKSWWLEHGIGCRVNNDTWVGTEPVEAARKIPPEEFVEGCLLDYYYVEVIHAGVQCLLALAGFVFTCMAIYIYSEEHESSTSANDELEFVKMHTISPSRGGGIDNPGRQIAHQSNTDVSVPMETETRSTHSRATDYYQSEYPTLDRPPSYETSMRNNVSSMSQGPYQPADRQSMRSTRSVRSARSTRSARSKASNRSKRRERAERREDLPWVQITPSSSNQQAESAPYRHFP